MDRAFPKPIFDDEIERRERLKAEEADRREAFRLQVREEFPEITAWADEVRRVFGDGVRLIWAVEDGKAVGRVPEEKRQQYEAEHGPLIDVRPNSKGRAN